MNVVAYNHRGNGYRAAGNYDLAIADHTKAIELDPRFALAYNSRCADFTSKRVWGLKQTDRKLTSISQLCVAPEMVASFGRDEAGKPAGEPRAGWGRSPGPPSGP